MTSHRKRKALGPRGAQTREKLVSAGRKAFAAKGLGGASLREDILAPTSLSAGSFYHQFPDKASLLAEIIREDGARIIRELGDLGQQGTGQDPAMRAAALMSHLFDRAEKNPYFVKIFVREYYSESKLVQREIQKHTANTTAVLRAVYERLGETTGLGLDTHSLSVILSHQTFSLLNHYVGLSKRQRADARPILLRAIMQLMAGGVLAVRDCPTERPRPRTGSPASVPASSSTEAVPDQSIERATADRA